MKQQLLIETYDVPPRSVLIDKSDKAVKAVALTGCRARWYFSESCIKKGLHYDPSPEKHDYP